MMIVLTELMIQKEMLDDGERHPHYSESLNLTTSARTVKHSECKC